MEVTEAHLTDHFFARVTEHLLGHLTDVCEMAAGVDFPDHFATDLGDLVKTLVAAFQGHLRSLQLADIYKRFEQPASSSQIDGDDGLEHGQFAAIGAKQNAFAVINFLP